MRAHTTHEAPDVFGFRDDVPPELAAIVQQCLSKSPDDRVQSPDELATALAPWSENSDLPALMEQTPASLRHDAAFESTDIVTNHAASTLGSQSGEATETTEGSGQAASAELSGKQALHRRRTGWMLTTGIAAAAVLAATIYHSRTRPTGTGEQNQGRVADTGNSPLPEELARPSATSC